MSTVEELQLQLEDLKEARRSGLKRVIYEGRDTTFKSDADMAAAQADLEREIRRLSGKRRRTTTVALYRSGRR